VDDFEEMVRQYDGIQAKQMYATLWKRWDLKLANVLKKSSLSMHSYSQVTGYRWFVYNLVSWVYYR
jgi:hypothetical protein